MEKYLIILIIIITIIVCYCTVCDKKETKETKETKKTKESFTNADPNNNIDYNNAVYTLAAIAKDLQNPSGLIIPGNLNLKNNVVLVAENNILKLKTPDLSSNASLNVKNLDVDGVSNLTPKGGIIMWRGTVIPPTWAFCDGQNGTPDLRGRFILGMGQGAGLTNRVLDAKGGAETVKLEIPNLPSHTHYYTYSDFNDRSVSNGSNAPTLHQGNVKGKETNPTGGNQPHENMPPFYVLAYIMKL